MRKFLTFLAVAFVMAAAAQESEAPDYGDFTLDAQVRSRGEFRTGLGTLPDGYSYSNLFVNDRVRLGFGWERNNISMRIAVQHAGVWQNGDKKNTLGNITLHEAWAKMTFGKGFFAQVGRQELSYDDERLFGTHDWAPSGRAHDALRLGWGNEKNQLHVIASFNQTTPVTEDFIIEKTNLRLYRNMQTLWYHFGAAEGPFQVSLLFSNQGVADASGSGTNYMQTFGTYMNYEKRKFFFDTSLYYQIGSDRTGTDVSAFLLSGNFGLKLSPKWRLSIGDDYLSGSDGMPGTTASFNTLYGSHHNFLGSMDYYGYGTVPLYGINDINMKAVYRGGSKFDMKMAFHWLSTGRPINNYLCDPIEEITDPAKIEIMRRYNGKYRFSQNLGGEFDLEASVHPWKNVTIRAGYSMMIASETIQLFKGEDAGSFQNWGWVSLDLTPTMFSTRHRR